MEFLPLHTCPEYMVECAEVLNEQWKRSLSARLHSLEKSRDSFPTCCVLLERKDGGERCVVGHSRLSDVIGQQQKACLLESVVVKKSHRGKGYGRIIMQHTEEFAASKGYKEVYLTTQDKQDFYKHLGYVYCSPIIAANLDILPENLVKQLCVNVTPQVKAHPCCDKKSTVKAAENESSATECSKREKTKNGEEIISQSQGTEMDKNIAPPPVIEAPTPVVQAPPPPPPPGIKAPPPPPPVNKNCFIDKGDGEAVVRCCPDLSKVSWMKKCIG